MNTLQNIVCTNVLGNTGVAKCVYDPKNIIGAVLVPAGTTYTQTQQAGLLSVLIAAAKANSPTARIFPIKRFIGMESVGSENVLTDDAYGGKSKSRQGKYGWVFQYKNGGIDLHTALMSFDMKEDLYDLLLIDGANNTIWGTTNSPGVFSGFTLELIDVQNISITPEDTMYKIGFYLEDPDEINYRSATYAVTKSTSIIKSLSGLLNIRPIVHTANVSGLVKLQLFNGETNLADVYPTELATAALYTAIARTTQAAITVTSVTYAAATKSFNVQLDASDADYIAVATGGYIDISIGGVTALETALVIGYAETTIGITK